MTNNNINNLFTAANSSWKSEMVTTMGGAGYKGFSTESNEVSIEFKQFTVGDMLNLYQDMIVKSKWDVRLSDNVPSLLLGRNHMFYNKGLHEIKIDSDKIINYEVDESLQYVNWNFPIDVMEQSLKKEYGNKIKKNEEDTIVEMNTKEDLDILNRISVRKFSENHFAISGYNLVGYQIDSNNDIPNAVFSKTKKEENRKYITILSQSASELLNTDADGNKIKDKNFIPPFEQLNAEEDFFNIFRNAEYLSTQLLKELEYSYQGKIFITFNDDIELGDKITLLDNATGTYGVFEIDAFEHILDERGLITCLFVKASVDIVDPFLDQYYYSIAYELINDFKENVLKLSSHQTSVTENIKIKNIYGMFLKHLIQAPKYAPISNYETEPYSFFDSNKILEQFNIPLPIRLMPYIKKGKFIIPSTLELAFFNSGNQKLSFYEILLANIKNWFASSFEALGAYGASLAIFVADSAISMISMGISDMVKPYAGITESKAFDAITNNYYGSSNALANYTTEYNPYSGIYTLNKKYDLTIGFFNVQAQRPIDMLPISNDKYEMTQKQFDEKITLKTSTIKKILADTFDCTFLVELYDSFKYKKYSINDFILDIKPSFMEESPFIIQLFENYYGREFGCMIKRTNVNVKSQKQIALSGKRQAIETTIDISQLEIRNIQQVKIIWFHNIYGDSKLVEENTLEERKENVDIVLNKYENEIDNNTAIVVMADFNLNVINYNELPDRNSSSEKNAVYIISKDSKFEAKIDKPTTLNQLGLAKGNPYDNVLISKNLKGLVDVGRFNYPIDDDDTNRLIVSDHIPVWIGFKRK